MYRRRFLAAKARYRCEWKCTRCGRNNRERSEVGAADRIWINQFTDNLYDEVQLSGELAQEKARKRLFRLQEAVNEMHWLSGLRVSGSCPKCGHRQFWAPSLRHTWAAALAAACFAAFAWLIGFPDSGREWLACLGVSAVSVFFVEGVALLLIRWRLEHLSDPDCAPQIGELFPEK